MRHALPALLALLLAASPGAAAPGDADWDVLLSLSGGERAAPRVRQLDGETPFSATVRERAPRDLGEFGSAARQFYARPQDHIRGALRDEGEARRFAPYERDAFDSHWTETPRANPYARTFAINRSHSPLGHREYDGTDAYVAPEWKPLGREEQRAYRTAPWTSAEIKRRLADLYGRKGCCGD